MKGKCNRLYNIWYEAKRRCTDSKSCHYKNYGGRGIKVCDEWFNNFNAFENWALSNGYQENLTLDRIDFNKGYSPDNCRWATVIEQANNRSTNVYYEINGETKTLAEWCRVFGAGYDMVKARIRRGMTICDALSIPKKSKSKNLTGLRFGQLMVKRLHHIENKKAYFECVCDCGQVIITQGASLTSRRTKSCGCSRKYARQKKVINMNTGEVYSSVTECVLAIHKSKPTVIRMLNSNNSYLKRL